jgi:hypothetical protein
MKTAIFPNTTVVYAIPVKDGPYTRNPDRTRWYLEAWTLDTPCPPVLGQRVNGLVEPVGFDTLDEAHQYAADHGYTVAD